LKKAPPNWQDIITKKTAWSDTDFEGKDTLYWSSTFNPKAGWITKYDTCLDKATEPYCRFYDVYTKFPGSNLLNDKKEVTFTEPKQGGAGTCYIMSSVATVAEFPTVMNEVFLTKEKNEAGIMAVQFYIRGKPWHVTLDTKLLFNVDNQLVDPVYLEFAGPDDTKKIMWGALLEKAWAKVKGNYDNADGGFVNSGLRVLTNVPVFTYSGKDLTDQTKQDATWNILVAADKANYVIGAGTDGGGNDQENNSCGMAMSHAYTILSTFLIGAEKLLLIRNPWGSTHYSLAGWKHDSAIWTAENIKLVPLGINPTTSHKQGIFVMPYSKFYASTDRCLDEIMVGHMRNGEGYKDSWYDKDGDDDGVNDVYKVTVPAKSGDLYFTAETYFQRTIPNSCFTGGEVTP